MRTLTKKDISSQELQAMQRALDKHSIVSVTDVQGKITYVNDLFVEISGYSEAELIGQTHRIIRSNAHADAFYRDMWCTIASGNVWQGVIQNRRKSGDPYWVKSTISPIFDQNGKPEKYLAIRTDITKEKQAESAQQLATSLNLASEEACIYYADDLKFLFLNETVKSKFGISDDDVHMYSPLDFVIDKSEVQIREILRPLVDGETDLLVYERLQRRSDGSSKWVEIRVQLVCPAGERPRFVAIQRDVSEQKEIEKELWQAKSSLDNMKSECYVISPETYEFLYLNKAALSETGWMSGDWKGKTIGDANAVFGAPNSIFEPENFTDIAKPLSSGQERSTTIEFVGKAGKFYEALLQYLQPTHGNPHYLLVIIDITERRQLEKEARNFKTTLDYIDNAVFMFWPDTLEFFYVNQAAIDQHGWSAEEFERLTPVMITPEFGEQTFGYLAKSLINGKDKSISFETLHQRKDGSVFPVDILLQYIEPMNDLPRFIAVTRDITERKNTEREILRLKMSLDMSQDEEYFFRPDTLKYLYVNNIALKRHGWDVSEFRDKTLHDADPDFDETLFREQVKPLISGKKEAIFFEQSFPGIEHAEVTIQYISIDNSESHFVATVRDVTERKNAEKKLLQIYKAMDSTNDGIFVFEVETLRFIYLNRASMINFGWSIQKYRKKYLGDAIANFNEQEFRKLTKPLVFGEVKSVIFEVKDLKGSPFEISVQISESEDGVFLFTAVARDISIRKEVDKKKAEFTATVSHELRTPLTSISGSLQLVLSGAVGELPEKVKRLINIADKNAKKLTLLIDDILDLSKLESENMDFTMGKVDICDIIHDALTINEPYAKQYGVSFVPEGLNQTVFVLGNSDRLMQVMHNLLSNAVKFSGKSTKVWISLEMEEGSCLVSIKDEGVGIPEAAQAAIFDRFSQADASDTRKQGGTGLGLSIAKLIVEKHAGTLRFSSKPGEGSTFFFDIGLYR